MRRLDRGRKLLPARRALLQTSGHIEEGKPKHYQVTLKVGFTMEAPM
jgi:flavin-binding protein dodecin